MRATTFAIPVVLAVAVVAGCCGKKNDHSPVADPPDSPTAAARMVSVSRYQSSTLTDADADRILAEANDVLDEINGSGDEQCVIGFQRSGPVATFTTGDGEIDSHAEFNAIVALPGNMKVVNGIYVCGTRSDGLPNTGVFLGCAPAPGNSLVVVRMDDTSDRQEGILWAHEYGHNRGLHHRNPDDNEVMNAYITSAHTYVNGAEKLAYEDSQAAQGGAGQAAAAAPATAPATAPAPGAAAGDVKAFVRRRYIEGIPLHEASTFGPAVVPELITMLDDPADAPWRANIVKLLGIIGDPRAVDPLIKVIEDGQGVLKPSEYGAKKTAIVSLGDVIRKSQNPNDPAVLKANDYLARGLDPAIWSQRVQWEGPFIKDVNQRNWQLTKSAIWGLASTGKAEAGQALEALEAKLPKMGEVPPDLRGILKEAKTALNAVRAGGVKPDAAPHHE